MNKEMTMAERREAYNEIQKQMAKEQFEKARNALQLFDPTKSESRTYTLFSKTVLRQYMQNPFNNQASLRNLSRYLRRVVQIYDKIIHYYSRMIDLTAYDAA